MKVTVPQYVYVYQTPSCTVTGIERVTKGKQLEVTNEVSVRQFPSGMQTPVRKVIFRNKEWWVSEDTLMRWNQGVKRVEQTTQALEYARPNRQENVILQLYVVRNMVTHHEYIGVSVNAAVRFGEHLQKPSNAQLRAAITQHGKNAFQMSVVTSASLFEALWLEMEMIRLFKQAGKTLYNNSDGGEFPMTPQQETEWNKFKAKKATGKAETFVVPPDDNTPPIVPKRRKTKPPTFVNTLSPIKDQLASRYKELMP